MKQLITKSLLFAFITCLAGSLLTPFLKTNKYWGNKEYDWKLTVYKKEKYNTVLFGTSRIYRGIDPLQFDSLVNQNTSQSTKSFNLATHAAWANETFFLYDEFLKDTALSSGVNLVFMEYQNIMSIRPEKINSPKVIYYQNLDHYWFMWKYSVHEVIREPKKIITSTYSMVVFSVVSFINFTNLKVINLKMNTKEPMGVESINPRGYLGFPEPLKGKQVVSEKVIKSFTNNIDQYINTTPADYNIVFYDKMMEMINKSRQKGIKLIFVLPPVRLTKGMMAVFNALPNENKIEICDPHKFPELYNPDNWIDTNHLNRNGAYVLTNEMAKQGARLIDD